jgi:hypothetical protein
LFNIINVTITQLELDGREYRAQREIEVGIDVGHKGSRFNITETIRDRHVDKEGEY